MAHDPIPELGWPAMQMDMDVAGFDAAGVLTGQPVEFDLAKGEDGLFTIVAVRSAEMAAGVEMEEPEPAQNMPEAALPPITVSGTIDAIDPDAGKATITHGPIAEIGMPGMTMDFALDAGLDPAALTTGEEMPLTFVRPDGMKMVLAGAKPATPPIEVSGTINTVDPEAGTANITHGPMTQIGMPGMTMDFGIDPSVDTAGLQTGAEVTLLLIRNPDFSMTLVGTRAPEAGQ